MSVATAVASVDIVAGASVSPAITGNITVATATAAVREQHRQRQICGQFLTELE